MTLGDVLGMVAMVVVAAILYAVYLYRRRLL